MFEESLQRAEDEARREKERKERKKREEERLIQEKKAREEERAHKLRNAMLAKEEDMQRHKRAKSFIIGIILTLILMHHLYIIHSLM